MAPRPIASALQDEEERSESSFPFTWILAIVFNVLFIICLFIAIIYCIKRRKKKLPDTQETKPSPIFRKRTISQSFNANNFQFSTPSSAGSFRTTSSSGSKKSRKSNRVSSVDMVETQTKTQIESTRPISPVRYNSPPLAKPLSSVYTVQQDANLENITSTAQPTESQPNGLQPKGISQATFPNISARKPSLSFKHLALMQARLQREMNDSRVKLKALDFEQSNDLSEGNEENSKQTINNDIESLDSTEVINDENDSINSLEMSGDEANADKKHKTKDTDSQAKDELIEQLSQKLNKEQVNSADQNLPINDDQRTKLNNSEAELNTDSGIGDSQVNLSNVTQLASLPTSTHVPNTQQAAISAAASAVAAASTVIAAGNQSGKSSNPINKQLTKLDSFGSKKISTPPARDSPSIHVGSVKEFSFSQINRPDRQNESGADRPLHELQNSSKAIARQGSRKSRNGSGKRKRLKSAGVQTTPSLRRSTPQPRPVQNKESTFSSVYTDIASKLDPTEQAEQVANMEPIEEADFFYSPESELQERKYFIYLISDTSNPYYKKDCIGKILLPARGQLTLAELRDQLFKQSEDSVKTILKKGKNFRFLTETYRFVAQNESIASVKEVYPTQGIFLKLNSSDNPVAYGRSKTTNKNDLTNLINAALTESQITQQPGKQSPFPGNAGGGKGRTVHLKAYSKDLTNLNKEAAAIGDIPKVHLSRAEHESSQSFSPLPPFLSFNNNTPSLRTVSPDQRSAVLREALFRRHGRCLYPQPIVRRALPKSVVAKGEFSKKCNYNGCPLLSMLKCAKCGRAYYCSTEHKREHWSEHRAICHKPPWKF